MSAAPDDLAALVAEPVVFVASSGERVELAALKVRQLPAFARALAPLMGALGALAAQGGPVVDVSALVAEHGEHVAQAVAVACARPLDWVLDLDAVDFIGLAAQVIEMNQDFFGGTLALVMRLRQGAAPTATPTPTPAAPAAGST
ncbi:MAG: hypothetical protein RLY71_425 [Pseudomonadota bacterium]|jgi:hypothetical protein